MNTIKKTTLALVGLWAIATSAYTFADEDNTSMNNTASGSMSMEQGHGKMHRQGTMNESFRQYLRTDLTDAEKTTLTTLEKTHRDTVKALMENTQSGSLIQADSDTQMKTMQSDFMTALLPYVATDKQDAFKSFMVTIPQSHSGMTWQNDDAKRNYRNTQSGSTVRPQNTIRENMASQRGSTMQKNSLLPANISSLIDTKLASFSTDDTKLTWLNTINRKIDTLVTRVSAQKSKDLLAALKDLLNQKIDTIGSVGVDSSTINDLLQ